MARRSEVLSYRVVKVNVDRRLILRLYNSSRYLSDADYYRLRKNLKQIEEGFNKLAHAKSLVEKCLLRSGYDATKP